MDLRTYRANSMQEALRLVRRELGPDASVLHTRELNAGLLGWLGATRQVEVVASCEVAVPSRLPESLPRPNSAKRTTPILDLASASNELLLPPAHQFDYRAKFRDDLQALSDDSHSTLDSLSRKNDRPRRQDSLDAQNRLLDHLRSLQFNSELANELVDRVCDSLSIEDWKNPARVELRLLQVLENEIPIRTPIRVVPSERSIVALVGPTGVGKTTTIAKLAATFHLKEKQRVGLITVDTYRIAAVEQLRTYAQIIDLPMEVVATPREMQRAIARLADCDLILLDTAGRSPRDDLKIQELKSILAEAQAHEVHLVLSSVASETSILQAAQRFADLGATSLVLTKLDEATGLGGLIPLFRKCGLALSYVTSGQDVPNDLTPADPRKLARRMLRADDTHP